MTSGWSSSGGSGGRDVRGADWDLCTTFVKTGKCARADCNWRHENAEWWEGSWWSLDEEGRSWGWWQSLPVSEECPVSLTPICLLSEAPFELRASGSQAQGSGNPQSSPLHRFDAAALAKYVVGSGQFMDPVNRRPLTREECLALDRATHGMFHVAVGFAAVQQAGGAGRSRASREMAVAARQLFVLPSASAGMQGPPQPTNGCNRTDCQPQPQQQQQQRGTQEALVVHREGGLQVVDDSVGELEAAEVQGGVMSSGTGQAPTPAEALAKAKNQRPNFAPRARPAPAFERVGGPASGSKRKGAGETEKPRPILIEEEPQKPHVVILEEDPHSTSAASSVEAWVPPWATPQLQAVLLDELTRLSDRGSLRLVDDDKFLEALRSVQAKGELFRREAPVLCEADVSVDVAVRFAVPTFYPTQLPTVAEARRARATKVAPAVLRGVERELRRELVRLEEAKEPLPLTAVLRFIRDDLPPRLEALIKKAEADLQAIQAAAAAAPPAAAARPAAAAAAAEEDPARCARVGEKFSPNWDLCTAFVKNGKCKNKNCKWRHEKPAPPPSVAASASAAEAKPETKAPQKSGKSKK